MIKLVLTLSICINLVLTATLFTAQSDQFIAIVDAARSVQESQKEVKRAVENFNSVVDKVEQLTSKIDSNVEQLTSKIDSNVVQIEESIEAVRTSIGRIEEIVTF